MQYTFTAFVVVSLLAALGQVARGDWSQDDMCPTPSDDFTYFPSVDDCSQYWLCYDGMVQLMSCPSNFYWNSVNGYCDYMENVDCNENKASTTKGPVTTTTPGTTPVTTASTTAITEATTANTEATPTTTTGSTLCSDEANDGHFFIDPDDCSKYFECNKGDTIVFDCPPGTRWSEELLACDYAENVACENE